MSQASLREMSTIPDDASTAQGSAVEHAGDSQAHDLDLEQRLSAVTMNVQLINCEPTIIYINLEGSETIGAHLAILRHYSPWFAKRFEQDRAYGTQVQPVQVSSNDSMVFRSLLHWMYYNQIMRFDDCGRTLPGLIHLWVVANLYEVSSLCNETIDLIYEQVHLMAFEKEVANLVWNLTGPNSKLRDLFVRGCARRSRLHLFTAEGMPPEFCTRLIRELYELKSESHAGTEDLNRADKKLDLCLFHEHPQQVKNILTEPVGF